ncbi:MAG: T9SS type A sorting domain-containing protein [Marinoscillum sp.]
MDSTKKIAILNTTSPATKCENLPIKKPTLTLSIPDTSSYQWSFDDKNGLVYVALIPSDTLVFTISETDSTSTTQINNYFNNCSDTTLHTCSSLTLNFYNHPDASNSLPVITQTDTLLTAFHEEALSYQWYYNNEPVEGASSDSFIFSQQGTYYVEATLSSGCHTSSEVFVFIIPEEPLALNKNSFTIWPNPASDVLHLTFEIGLRTEVSIDLIDQTGRTVLFSQLINQTGSSAQQIDISGLKTGLYFLRIQSGDQTTLRKVFKL